MNTGHDSDLGTAITEESATVRDLRSRLQFAEATLQAIRTGQADAIVVDGGIRPRVFTLQGTGEVYQTFVETMNEGALTIDDRGVVLYANRQVAQMLGLALERLIGSMLLDHLVGTGDVEAVADVLAGATVSGLQIQLRRADGHTMPVLISARAVDTEDTSTTCVVLTDLTEVMAGQVASRRLAAIVDGTDDAVVGLSVDGAVESVNVGAGHIFGFAPAEVIGQSALSVFGAEVALLAAAAAGQLSSQQADIRVTGDRTTSDVVSITASPVLSEDGQLRGVSLLGHDVTARHSAEERLRHRATHDDLTGLPNRAGLVDRITAAMRGGDEHHLALLFVDVDRFKLVNDTLGHAGGDELLRSIAQQLTGVLRAGDIAARVGGDEFVVMCQGLGKDKAMALTAAQGVAERLLTLVQHPVTDHSGHGLLTPTVSIGISLVRGSAHTAEGLLREADTAMYVAKQHGRARVVVFDADLRIRTLRRERQIADARRVLVDEQLQLHYQPVVRLSDGVVVGHEALLRWRHPRLGLIEPLPLLEVSDDAGMSLAIGEWVLATALHRLDDMVTGGYSGFMSVNLSASQVGRGRLLDQLGRLVAELSLDPAQVCLEVTEHVSLDRSEQTIHELTQIAEAGFDLALDDFGTGYASLTHLGRLPLTYLKIDKSFVASMGFSRASPAMVGPIIGLAQAAGLQVVAEGVESQAQADMLRQLGCAMSQGYLHGHPAP